MNIFPSIAYIYTNNAFQVPAQADQCGKGARQKKIITYYKFIENLKTRRF